MRAWCCVTIKTKTTVTHINLLMRETVRVAQIEQNQANHQTKKISQIILRAIYRDLSNCGRYCRKFFYFISWWKSWEKSLHWVTIDFSFEERGEEKEKEEEGNDENFFMFISSHFSGHAFNFLLTIVEK